MSVGDQVGEQKSALPPGHGGVEALPVTFDGELAANLNPHWPRRQGHAIMMSVPRPVRAIVATVTAQEVRWRS
jgi:hypothetical protein